MEVEMNLQQKFYTEWLRALKEDLSIQREREKVGGILSHAFHQGSLMMQLPSQDSTSGPNVTVLFVCQRN
jgi:hypothetical protein